MMKALSLALMLGVAPFAAQAQTPAPAHDHSAMTAGAKPAGAPAADPHAGMNHGAGGATSMAIPSTPADGATVQGSPAEIALTFPHAMKLASLRLTDDLGQTVDIGFKPGAEAVQVAKAPLPKLAPGRYEARWEGAAEGHAMGGTVRFTVR